MNHQLPLIELFDRKVNKIKYIFRQEYEKQKKKHTMSDDSRVDITPPSVDDNQRKELLWERREEKVLLQWCEDCKRRSARHDTKGKMNKIKFGLFTVPSILIPIILGGVSPVVPCHSLVYSLGMMSAGLFGGINAFWNFGKKESEHFEFMNRFFELANEIESELCKPKAARIACDVYMEKIKQIYNKLCSVSPTL